MASLRPDPPFRPRSRSHRAVLPWLVAGNLAVAVLLVGLAVLSLATSRQALRERAWIVSENLADSLARGFSAELAQADMVLRHLAVQYRDAGGAPLDLHALQDEIARVPPLSGIRFADAQGRVRMVQGQGAGSTDIGGQDVFRRLRERRDAGVLLTEPMRETPDQPWLIALSRRVEDRQGRFLGVLQGLVTVDHFRRRVASVRLGDTGAVTVRTASLRLVARHVPGQEARQDVGSARVSAELMRGVRERPERGAFVATTAVDGIERINSYQQVPGYPLLVLVGVGSDEFMAPWRTQCLQVGGLVGLIMLGIGASSLLLYRLWRRQTLTASRLLAESHRNHALLLTASDGVHVLDRGGHLIELSDSFAAMLLHQREALLGRHVTSWDQQFPASVVDHWLQTLAVGARHKFETRHRRADGSTIEVEVNCVGVRLDDSELVFCSARDISERRRLERELAASAAQLRDLYDHAPCGYHSLDARGRFLHINETELAWLGCSREEAVGRLGLADFLAPESQALFGTKFQELKERGEVANVEYELVSRDGRVRRVNGSASAVRDEHGQFVMSRSVLYDVTELQQARQKLTEVLHEQQVILDNSVVAIAKSRDHRLVWCNPAMGRLFGRSIGELMSQTGRVLFADEDAYQAFVREAYPPMQGGGRYHAQLKLHRQDGQQVWVDINGVMISADRKDVLWLMTDISAVMEAKERTQHLAFHDPLTGLANRLLLRDRLDHALAWARRHAMPMAVCYLDLDGFKAINDAHGHEAGDAVLKEVAARLQACVRLQDTVARLGGDEFVVLLPAPGAPGEHEDIVRRMRDAVRRPLFVGGVRVAVSASIGVAVHPEDGDQPDELLRRADQAMYAAKARVAAAPVP